MSMPILKLNIARKLVTITLLCIGGMLLILLLFYQGLESALIQEKELQSQKISDAGISIIKHFYTLTSTQALKESDAKALALNTLKSTKVGKNGYFWINDSKGMLLMHPYNSKLEGKNIINRVDINGIYMVRDFIKTAFQGGGMVEYYWPKPHSSQQFSKNSYVAFFAPWNWILGTGLYLDDIEKEVRAYTFSALGIVFIFIVILVLLFLTMIRKLLYQLEDMAIHDPLTGLYSRRYLTEYMDDLRMKHQRHHDKYLSVIFFDIDLFKKVNDSYGHLCGDDVLSRVGKIIKNLSRPDDLCVRYGGEEFMVISLSENKDTAMHLAERIRSKSHEIIFSHKDIKLSITLSAGIAFRENDEALDMTLKRADENLYSAKSKGRNCIILS